MKTTHFCKRIFLLLLAFALALPAYSAAAEGEGGIYQTVSPSSALRAAVTIENGALRYSVYYNNALIIPPSRLGLVLDSVDFTSGVEFADVAYSSFDETYPMISGKAAQFRNHANQMELTVQKDGKRLGVIVRAYDDGVAIRYCLPESAAVLREATEFTLTAGADVCQMEYERCYEDRYGNRPLTQLNGSYAIPLTATLPDGTCVLISEADLNASYCGSMVTSTGDGVLHLAFEPKQTEPVVAAAPFRSPWRVMVIGSPATVAETQIFENLCPPCQIADTSWIQPGVSSWTWFNGDPTDDPEVYKQYIDLAASMGWQYVLLDEGWQPRAEDYEGRKSYAGISAWVPDVISYASAKGIGIVVWSTWWDLDTPQKRERLREWASLGIKGVKIDFFDNETQSMLQLFDEITRQTAELRLLTNYHGCNKPTGERRTWPHLITREAVYGNEHYRSGEGWGPTAEHNCSLPYTRNAVGPMDFTPAIYDYQEKYYTTSAHRGALPIIFESGIQCLADKPWVYEQSPLSGLLSGLPAAWDRTALLDGKVGQSVVMLRQKADTYYIGSICNAQKTVDLALDFLPEGSFDAVVYTDQPGGRAVQKHTWRVTRQDVLTLPQLESGGAAVKITPHAGQPADVEGIHGHWSQTEISRMAEQGRLNGYFHNDFAADAAITRAEFVALLTSAHQMAFETGEPEFLDSYNHWAKNYIYTVCKQGIIQGVSPTAFDPDSPITREQAATIIGRMLKLESGAAHFIDAGQISDYAAGYVAACQENGLIQGYADGSFQPHNEITRAEAAVILARSLSKQ